MPIFIKMNIQNLVLLFISFFIITSSIFIIGAKNPIYSLFFLILIFFIGSFFLLYINMEFFALIFLIVYVGAIVVLFLFIIMMLQLKILNISNNYIKILISLEFWFGLFFINIISYGLSEHIYNSQIILSLNNINNNITVWGLFKDNILNISLTGRIIEQIELIGKALFLDYFFSFLIVSFLLFIAMIGSIVLTHEILLFKKVKEQNMSSQTLKNNIFISFQKI